MIEPLPHTPDNLAAFRAFDEVTKQDFETVVLPDVQKRVQKYGKLNYLLLLDTSVKNFTFGAWMQDALLGIKHLTDWNKAAIVSDSAGIKFFTDLFSLAIPGEFKGFYPEDLQKAIDWASEKKP